MKSRVTVSGFVLVLVFTTVPCDADIVQPTVQYSSRGQGTAPISKDIFYGNRGGEYQAFLEFKSDKPIERAVLEFTSLDHIPAKLFPIESFSIYIYEANGQMDTGDWNRGVHKIVLQNSGDRYTHHSIDVTEAYQKLQRNGVPYIGFRFADVSIGDFLALSDARLSISTVPEPSPIAFVLPALAIVLSRCRRKRRQSNQLIQFGNAEMG